MDKQSIVFAFYKKGELIGYRLDTMGSIGIKGAKIYTYSKEQVETVLKNINYNVQHKEGFGVLLGSDTLANKEEEINTLLQDKKAFEVRVLKAPSMIYEKEFDVVKAAWKISPFGIYPYDEMQIWLQYPEEHKIIEIHYFSMDGLINLQ